MIDKTQLKEEFEAEYKLDIGNIFVTDSITTWWFQKLEQALEEQKEEIRKEIKTLIEERTSSFPLPTIQEDAVREVLELPSLSPKQSKE